jgi:hypothetical protein
MNTPLLARILRFLQKKGNTVLKDGGTKAKMFVRADSGVSKGSGGSRSNSGSRHGSRSASRSGSRPGSPSKLKFTIEYEIY